MFAILQAWGIRDCTDGASNTLAVSERLIGDNNTGSRNGAEEYFGVPWPSGGDGLGMNQVATNPTGYSNLQQYIQSCDSIAKSGTGKEYNDTMSSWPLNRMHYGPGMTMLLTPNSPHASCGEYQADDGTLGARSRHPGGVNALFADGSVHFMKNSINTITWFALGTKAGGEVISADSY